MVKKYDEFLTEKLSKKEKYILKNLPYLLSNKLVSKLIGAAPFLPQMWKNLKSRTRGDWSFYSGTPSKIKSNLEKVKISDLPETPLKKGLYPLFNNWNIYKSDRKQSDRTVFFISKDELKIGDNVISTRESAWEVDKKSRKPNENDPIFILCAKYDIDEFLHIDLAEDIENIINSDIEDVDVKVDSVRVSLENDMIFCEIFSNEDGHSIIPDKELVGYLMNNSKRVLSFLKSQTKKEWLYSISFFSGTNNISIENQIKILDNYQKKSNFWESLSSYNLYSEERPKYLERLYSEGRKEYVARELFNNGMVINIFLIKNSETIIENFDLENQKISKINVNFKLKK